MREFFWSLWGGKLFATFIDKRTEGKMETDFRKYNSITNITLSLSLGSSLSLNSHCRSSLSYQSFSLFSFHII